MSIDPLVYPAPPLGEVRASVQAALTEYALTHCGREFTELSLTDQVAVLERFHFFIGAAYQRVRRGKAAIDRRESRRGARA